MVQPAFRVISEAVRRAAEALGEFFQRFRWERPRDVEYWQERALAAEARVGDLEARIEVRRTLKARSPARWRFRVLRWEKGEQLIKPKEYPEGKTVPNLRIHIHPDDPSEGAPYWDITSKRLIAMLEPILPGIAGTDTYVDITKDGEGRTSSFSVSILPA